MSNSAVNNPAYPAFVRRRIGRAPSPPTWACYEQIPFDDEYSDSGSEDNSCSEDEEDYGRAVHPGSDVSDGDPHAARENGHALPAGDDIGPDEGDEAAARKIAEYKKDVKGKQRAIEPEPEPESPRRQHRKKRRQPVFTLRPILTIQRSQGFVWNQDLFVPPYIKDRCSFVIFLPCNDCSSNTTLTSCTCTDYMTCRRRVDFSAERVGICVSSYGTRDGLRGRGG